MFVIYCSASPFHREYFIYLISLGEHFSPSDKQVPKRRQAKHTDCLKMDVYFKCSLFFISLCGADSHGHPWGVSRLGSGPSASLTAQHSFSLQVRALLTSSVPSECPCDDCIFMSAANTEMYLTNGSEGKSK